MIAMALSCRPKLLIADEPTTALDVTIQSQILDLIRELQQQFELAVLLVTHDLGIVAEYADDVTILYSSRVMERTGATELFAHPLNPYTCALLESIPGAGGHKHRRLQAIPGTIPESRGSAQRMPLPSALPAGDRGLQPRRSAIGGQAAQPLCRLHPCLVLLSWRRPADRFGAAQAVGGDRKPGQGISRGGEGLFGGRKLTVKAVDGVSIGIASGTKRWAW